MRGVLSFAGAPFPLTTYPLISLLAARLTLSHSLRLPFCTPPAPPFRFNPTRNDTAGRNDPAQNAAQSDRVLLQVVAD